MLKSVAAFSYRSVISSLVVFLALSPLADAQITIGSGSGTQPGQIFGPYNPCPPGFKPCAQCLNISTLSPGSPGCICEVVCIPIEQPCASDKCPTCIGGGCFTSVFPKENCFLTNRNYWWKYPNYLHSFPEGFYLPLHAEVVEKTSGLSYYWSVVPNPDGSWGSDLVEFFPGGVTDSPDVFVHLLAPGLVTIQVSVFNHPCGDCQNQTYTFQISPPRECPVTCQGDLNNDGKVDGADLGLVLGEWGCDDGACLSDLSGDGIVDGADLGIILGAWGDCLSLCGPPASPFDDCNNNNISDWCEVSLDQTMDCNQNFIPDSCDIASGLSKDCNKNGIPDECESCPVDLVVIMDTSGSMGEEAYALCTAVGEAVNYLQEHYINVHVKVLRVAEAANVGLYCMGPDDYVIKQFGKFIPDPNIPGIDVSTTYVGACADISLDIQAAEEDWGAAVAVVAKKYPWRLKAKRFIMPISDAPPRCGEGCVDFPDSRDYTLPMSDYEITEVAKAICLENGVRVYGVSAKDSSACTCDLSQMLSLDTGGQWLSTQYIDPGRALTDAFVNMMITASTSDGCNCNLDQVLDECEPDLNGNGIPDSCE